LLLLYWAVGVTRVIEELERRRKIGRMKELPIACTLTPGAMADRGEWLRRLGAASLIAGERTEAGLQLRFAPAAEGGVREWVRAEQECCAFLSFDLDRTGDELRVAVAGPPGSEPVLDGLLAALSGNLTPR
jgi:hypothetical protein